MGALSSNRLGGGSALGADNFVVELVTRVVWPTDTLGDSGMALFVGREDRGQVSQEYCGSVGCKMDEERKYARIRKKSELGLGWVSWTWRISPRCRLHARVCFRLS